MNLKRIASSLSQPLTERRDYGSSEPLEPDDDPTGDAHWDIRLGMVWGTIRVVLEHERLSVFTKRNQHGQMVWVQVPNPPMSEIAFHFAKLLSGGP